MATSTRAGIAKPDLTGSDADIADVGAAFDDIDDVIVPIYPGTTERDAANPSPINGQVCYISNTSSGGRALQYYNGTTWVSLHQAPRMAQKGSTLSKALTTTVTSDPDLTLPVDANTRYKFEFILLVSGDASGDAKYRLSHPTNTTISWSVIGPGSSLGAAVGEGGMQGICVVNTTATTSGDIVVGCSSTSIVSLHWIRGSLVTSSTAGSLVLQWAQGTSHSNGTELRQGSFMVLERID